MEESHVRLQTQFATDVLLKISVPKSVWKKVKKEIFGRYNSGITPLKKSEIDNAVYDNDDLSNIFKSELKKDSVLEQKRTRWHKNLAKEAYVDEALNILAALKLKPKERLVKN